jgi:hypothetical protein
MGKGKEELYPEEGSSCLHFQLQRWAKHVVLCATDASQTRD